MPSSSIPNLIYRLQKSRMGSSAIASPPLNLPPSHSYLVLLILSPSFFLSLVLFSSYMQFWTYCAFQQQHSGVEVPHQLENLTLPSYKWRMVIAYDGTKFSGYWVFLFFFFFNNLSFSPLFVLLSFLFGFNFVS